MLNKIKNKKIFIGLILVFLLSVSSLFYSSKKTPPSSPSPAPLVPLQIVNSFPSSGKFVRTFPRTALVFTFNQPVSITKIRVEINPKTQISLSLSSDQNALYVRPTQPWSLNTEYNILVYGVGGSILVENKITFIHPSQNPETRNEPPGGI